MRKLIAIVLLVLPLTACNDGFSEMDWRYLPAGGGGGSSVPAPAPPAPGSQAPGTAASKMLQDPEAQTDSWEDPTFADSQGEAERNCEEKAATMTRNGRTLVRSDGARHVKGKLFQCQLVSEVPSDR